MEAMLLLTLWALLAGVVLMVAYVVIRLAVRDGMTDAQARLDRDRVRSEVGVGPERGPNNLPPRTP